MGLTETIITAILASGAWLLVIIFLGKSLVVNWLTKDIEKYKGQISAHNNERQIILSRVNEKRAEAIYKIYLGIIEYAEHAKKFVFRAEHITEPEREILINTLSDSANKFRVIYSENHLYLNSSTCNKINEVFKEVQVPAHKFIYAIGSYLHGGTLTQEEYVKEWEKAFITFADKIPLLLKELESQFRMLLGVED